MTTLQALVEDLPELELELVLGLIVSRLIVRRGAKWTREHLEIGIKAAEIELADHRRRSQSALCGACGNSPTGRCAAHADPVNKTAGSHQWISDGPGGDCPQWHCGKCGSMLTARGGRMQGPIGGPCPPFENKTAGRDVEGS